jgi:hypothetical protein
MTEINTVITKLVRLESIVESTEAAMIKLAVRKQVLPNYPIPNYSKTSHHENSAASTPKNKSYISVSTVNVNVYVLNVLSMVYFYVNNLGKHK